MRSSEPFLLEQRCGGGGERDGKGAGGLERACLRHWYSKGKLINPLTQGDPYPSKKKEEKSGRRLFFDLGLLKNLGWEGALSASEESPVLAGRAGVGGNS